MLIDVTLISGKRYRCQIDRSWHGVLEVAFATFGTCYVERIVNVDDTRQVWENDLIFSFDNSKA